MVGEILTVINIIYKPIEGFSAADKSRVYKLYHKTHVYVCVCVCVYVCVVVGY